MKKNLFCLLILSLTCVTSCDKIGYQTPIFQKAEELMPHHPDSALVLLKQVETLESLSRRDKAHYYLLWTEAQDKIYAEHTTDSLISIATDYYEKTDDAKRKAKAWYYKGRVNQDLNQPVKALKYYLKALRDEEQVKDYTLFGRINNHIGMLYTYQMMYKEALSFQKKAVESFRLQGDSTGQVFALRDLGRTFLMLGYRDSAIISNQKAISLMKERIILSIYTELASLYIKDQQITKAYDLLQIALSSTTKAQPLPPIYLVMGCLFQQTNNIDSARYYLQACVDSARLRETRAGELFHLKEIALAQKQWEQAASLSKRYELLRDSIDQEQQTESIRKTQAFYLYTQIEQELFQTLLYTSNLRFKYSLLIIFLFGIALYLTHHKREKSILLRQLKDNKLLIYKNKQTIDELYRIKDDLQQDILAYKNDQKEQAQKEKQLETLSLLKCRLEQDLISLQAENLSLRDRKKEKQNEAKQAINKHLWSQFYSPAGWEPTAKDWNILFTSIDECYPTFAIALQSTVRLDDLGKKICYLTKIRVKPSVIEILLHLENASIYRKRVYEKLTGKPGSAKDLDNFLHNLL